MTARFVGVAGRPQLVEVLLRQKLVQFSRPLAEDLADRMDFREFIADAEILQQDVLDNDIYFILTGKVRIEVNRRHVGHRHHGEHVGEMALIDPSGRRSATVRALERVEAGRVTGADFHAISKKHSIIWPALAAELATRLREREKFLPAPNHIPYIFIGSSSESKAIAEKIESRLAKNPSVAVTLWTHDVFKPSRFPLEDLEQQLKTVDFAILVGAADDRVFSRWRWSLAPRDNVIFELGLFMGALSRDRTFLVVPSDAKKLKIPSDLHGLNTLRYDSTLPLDAAIDRFCTELEKIFAERGPK